VIVWYGTVASNVEAVHLGEALTAAVAPSWGTERTASKMIASKIRRDRVSIGTPPSASIHKKESIVPARVSDLSSQISAAGLISILPSVKKASR
jgi:hypothetical protein